MLQSEKKFHELKTKDTSQRRKETISVLWKSTQEYFEKQKNV